MPGWPPSRAGCSRTVPELLDGVGLIVGIDRFMSEARALTNFAGNAVATVLDRHLGGRVGQSEGRIRAERARPL